MSGTRNQLMTELTPAGEALFQRQTADRAGDLQDYDLRGAWAQSGGGDMGDGHLPDTFKLPNHPTFSQGSMYATPEQPGGTWAQLPGGAWAFMPSATNDAQYGRTNLQDYFDRVEPNSLLLTR